MRLFNPPEDLTVSQWAERYRVLSRETAAEAGPWRNSRTPYLVEVMDAFTDPKINKITLVASSQVGKSEVELNIIGYIIDQDPGSILYIQPTLDDAKKFSRLRIAPMIRDSKRLRGKVADVRARDSGNTMLQKQFPGGMLTIVGSNSASGLASTPVKYVIGDEHDRWALSAGTEGDPWALAEARTTTFYNRKIVNVSTPTIKGISPIEKSYNVGTRERWCHCCPDCQEYSEITFSHIKFDFESKKTGKKTEYIIKSIHWACPSCGCIHSEDETRKFPAKWIAENPAALERGHRTFWLNAFSSPWQSWNKIVQAFLEARFDPERLKVVTNTMDYVFKASQATGTGFTELMQQSQQYGAQLQEMGYSFEESIALIGQLDKAGVETTEVLGAMKKAVTTMAKDGLSATDGLEQYAEAIKNAETATEATMIASEVFGSRAASTMASAIRDGSVSIDELTSSLMANSETISGAAEDTYDFAERLQLFKQKAQLALEPLAMSVFDSLNELMPVAAEAMEELIPLLVDVAGEIIPIVQELLPEIIPVLREILPMVGKMAKQLFSSLMPALKMIVSSVLPVLISLIESFAPLLATMLENVLPVIILLVETLLPPLIDIIEKLLPPLIEIIQAVLPVIITLIETILPIILLLWEALQPVLDVILSLITPLLSIIDALSPIIELFGEMVTTIIEALMPAIVWLTDLFNTVMQSVLENFAPVFESVIAIISGLIEFITNVFAGDWEAAWSSIVGVFENIWGAIEGIFKGVINVVIDILNWFIQKINLVSFDLPDWGFLGDMAGATIGFNIPEIPKLAMGGIVNEATLAMIGEGSEPEAVMPLSKLEALLSGESTNNKTVQVVYSPVFHIAAGASQEAVEAAAEDGFEQFKIYMERLVHDNNRVNFALSNP